MFRNHKKNYEEYREDWPLHYYEISVINDREAVLAEVLKENPESKEDQERLSLLHERFGKAKLSNRPDRFMRALLMLRQISDTRITALNRARVLTEVDGYLNDLQVSNEKASDLLKEEWKDLFDSYIRVTFKSFSKPAFLGMGKRTDDTVASHVKDDLKLILETVPDKFDMADRCAEIREIAYTEAKRLLED